jgi:hypothetical protein
MAFHYLGCCDHTTPASSSFFLLANWCKIAPKKVLKAKFDQTPKKELAKF